MSVDYFSAASDLLGGVSGFMGGQAQAAGGKIAAKFYGQAAQLSGVETGIKELALNRQIYQAVGGGMADAAASGLKQSGSAADVSRSSAEQGALSKALTYLQGNIQTNSYMAQEQSAAAAASSSSSGGWLSAIGSVVSIAAMFL